MQCSVNHLHALVTLNNLFQLSAPLIQTKLQVTNQLFLLLQHSTLKHSKHTVQTWSIGNAVKYILIYTPKSGASDPTPEITTG